MQLNTQITDDPNIKIVNNQLVITPLECANEPDSLGNLLPIGSPRWV